MAQIDEEEKAESIKRANALKTMLNTVGWKEVVKPALEQRKLDLLEQFKSEKEFSAFVYLQQSMLAIQNLESFIEDCIAEGKEASGDKD